MTQYDWRKPNLYKTFQETDMSHYDTLSQVLSDAIDQASKGKGRIRHATDGEPFERQQICEIARRLEGSQVAGVLFQAVKKVYESKRLDTDGAIQELLGAINYIAAGIILLKEKGAQQHGKSESIGTREGGDEVGVRASTAGDISVGDPGRDSGLQER